MNDIEKEFVSYSIKLNPAPYRTSTEKSKNTGNITLKLSKNKEIEEDVILNTVTLEIPYLDNTKESLFCECPKVSLKLKQRLPICTTEEKEEISILTKVFRMQTAKLNNENSFSFTMQGAFSRIPGEGIFYLTIECYLASNKKDVHTIKHEIRIPKEDPLFYAVNFLATKESKDIEPCANFLPNTSIHFKWNSNGKYFLLYGKNPDKPVYQGIETNFILQGGCEESETFTLIASNHDEHDMGKLSESELSQLIYQSYTITVDTLHADKIECFSLVNIKKMSADQSVVSRLISEPNASFDLLQIAKKEKWETLFPVNGYQIADPEMLPEESLDINLEYYLGSKPMDIFLYLEVSLFVMVLDKPNNAAANNMGLNFTEFYERYVRITAGKNASALNLLDQFILVTNPSSLAKPQKIALPILGCNCVTISIHKKRGEGIRFKPYFYPISVLFQ